MNDAGQDWISTRSASPVAWFQVGLPAESLAGCVLPVQSLLACVEDSIERVGRIRLDAAQVLVPVRLHHMNPSRLVSGLNWFRLSDPNARIPIRVTQDAGEDDVAQREAARILDGARRRHSGPFSLEEYSLGDLGTPREPIFGEMWLGAVRQPVTFAGQSPEWSFAAAGWLNS